MKRDLYKVLASAVCFAAALVCPAPWCYGLYAVSYLLAGAEVIKDAVHKIYHGELLDEDFLMTLATFGAIALGDYKEAVAVMLFFQVGELFEHYAVARSRKSIASLMEIRPDSATVLREGETLEVDPEEVQVGEHIRVAPGERIPLDGVVVSGSSTLDTAALTGEPLPRDAGVGDEVLSGCINQTGLLEIEVTKPAEESTVSRILDLVENATALKSKQERFITRFAHVYTPSVVGAAVLLAFVPPIFLGFSQHFASYLNRALMFLVVSCPCALVISVPLSFFGGIGGASKKGILIKGGSSMEVLAQADIAVFDKTGTLTKGVFSLTKVCPAPGCDPEQLKQMAAHAESASSHPIAAALREAWTGEALPIQGITELAGYGVSALVDGRLVMAGNRKLMLENDLDCPEPEETEGSLVHVSLDQTYLGYLVVADTPKEDAKTALAALRKAGIKKTVMLTGDRKPAALAMAKRLGVDEVKAELLPQDKVTAFESLMGQGKVVYVGDGINDAPVLARADVGIAMGALGSDAAIEASDIVIMTDQPSKIADAVAISRRVLQISKQNIVFALAVKALVLLLSALGMSNMWIAIFSDVGVAVLCILNAMRCLR